MIKAAIFDLDGTLLDRDTSVKKFIHRQYERLDHVVGHISRENYSRRFIELDNHGYVPKNIVYEQMVHEFKITQLTWKELHEDYLNEFKNDCVPFPNLNHMLQELKNRDIILGIITNGLGQFQMDNIIALGIEQYFKTILISEWEGIKKPDPEIFKRAMQQLNVSPNESIFVGDHPENDMKGAQSVGMKGVWKKDLKRNDVQADFIIQDLAEIPLIIEYLDKTCSDITN